MQRVSAHRRRTGTLTRSSRVVPALASTQSWWHRKPSLAGTSDARQSAPKNHDTRFAQDYTQGTARSRGDAGHARSVCDRVVFAV